MARPPKMLLVLVYESGLADDGDSIVAADIHNTIARNSPYGWKISKRDSDRPIDATVAAVLAVDRARHHKPPFIPRIDWM